MAEPHLSTDIFYARSTDGGLSFTKNVQVTTALTNETCCGADLGNQYGDYEGIAAMDGLAHPIWTDRRARAPALARGQAQPSVRDDLREREITRESWCCCRGCDTPVSALTREGMGLWPWDAAAGRAAYWRQHAYLPG
jgi:hypothetical protein